MAKQQVKKVKVIKFIQEGSAYGWQVCEVDESALTVKKKSEPEVFYIFITQIEKVIREILGL